MKKRFTLTILGLLLMVGGVMAQTVTTLYLNGGGSWSATDGTNYWSNNNTNVTYTSGIVTFSTNNFNGKWNGLTGSNWVADLSAEEIHTFTITLNTGAPSGFHFYIAAERYGDFSNNNARKYVSEIIPEGTTSISYSIDAKTYPDLLKGEGDNVGPYKYVYIVNEGSTNSQLNIASITRTVTTASSVAAPTISPASGTYDGDLSVTITPGEGNDKVVYSISGATTGNVTDAEINAAATVNLTGTGTITVTATGYKNNEASSEVTATYTYGIPSGKSSISEGLPHTFNSWESGNSLVIANSNFSNMEIGDYVVLGVKDVQADGTVLGFRADWTESPYSGCTSVSSGNGAKGVFNRGDTQWWLKASNNDVVNAFKNSTVRMQGGMIPKEVAGTSDDVTSSITLNSIAVYKSFAISETENNSITKYDNVVVELTRSLVADTWNTICLPFALTPAQATQLFGDDYKLAEFTSVSGETMRFTTASTFEAGKPYLVKPTVGLSNSSPVVLVDVNLTAKNGSTVTYNGYSFVGTLVKKTFTENLDYTRFVASGNELKKPNSGSTLKALRAYFILPASFDPSHAPKLSIDGDGEATEIISIDNERVIMDNVYYDLSGRRVMNPTKGLYIVNGRKVIVK